MSGTALKKIIPEETAVIMGCSPQYVRVALQALSLCMSSKAQKKR